MLQLQIFSGNRDAVVSKASSLVQFLNWTEGPFKLDGSHRMMTPELHSTVGPWGIWDFSQADSTRHPSQQNPQHIDA